MLFKDVLKEIPHDMQIMIHTTVPCDMQGNTEPEPGCYKSTHHLYPDKFFQFPPKLLSARVFQLDETLNDVARIKHVWIAFGPTSEENNLPHAYVFNPKFDIDYVKECMNLQYGYKLSSCNFKIKNVIFNGPATIVFWSDGTKTVVKCDEEDAPDYEKGILYAALKKLATKQQYNDILRTIDDKEESL